MEEEGAEGGLTMALVDVAGQALLVRTLLLEQTVEETTVEESRHQRLADTLGDIKRRSLHQEGSNPVRSSTW